MTMEMWESYEAEWSDRPTIDDMAAWYFQIKPKDYVEPKDESAMGPEDFLRFVKATGGSKLSPSAG